MTLTKWNPLRELETSHREMDRWSNLTSPMRLDGDEQDGRRHWTLSLDVMENEDEIRLKAALPGVEEKDINIQVEDGVLTISAERRMEEKVEKEQYHWIEQQYGSFSRSLTLPKYSDTDNIKAHFRDGVLELTVPKRETARPRKIELTASSEEPKAIEAGASNKRERNKA